MTDAVNIGVIGLGNVSKLNVSALKNTGHFNLTAICDLDPERLEYGINTYDVKRGYRSIDELLDDPEIEAVEILTPTHMHYEHVKKALGSNKHVSCQKPFTNSIVEAEELKNMTKKEQVLRISEFAIFYEPVIFAKKLLNSGVIGKVHLIRIKTVVGRTNSEFQSHLDVRGYIWRFNDKSPGGHLFDDMIHKFSLAIFLANSRPTAVSAIVRRGEFFFEAPSVSLIEYEDPELLTIVDVVHAPQLFIESEFYGAEEVIELQGEKGIIYVTRMSGNLFKLAPVILIDENGSRREFNEPNPSYAQAFTNSAQSFYESIRNGSSPMFSCQDAIEAMKLVFASYKSSNLKTSVGLHEIETTESPAWWPIFRSE